MFVNEFRMYLDYLQQQAEKLLTDATTKQVKYLQLFKDNLAVALNYYSGLSTQMVEQGDAYIKKMRTELHDINDRLKAIQIPAPCIA